MPEKVKRQLSEHEVLVNKFAFCLLKHWSKVKIQDGVIKIHTEGLCEQDLYFLTNLNTSTNGNLGLSILRSGKGVLVMIGTNSLTEIPEYLIKYKREDLIDLYKPEWVYMPK